MKLQTLLRSREIWILNNEFECNLINFSFSVNFRWPRHTLDSDETRRKRWRARIADLCQERKTFLARARVCVHIFTFQVWSVAPDKKLAQKCRFIVSPAVVIPSHCLKNTERHIRNHFKYTNYEKCFRESARARDFPCQRFVIGFAMFEQYVILRLFSIRSTAIWWSKDKIILTVMIIMRMDQWERARKSWVGFNWPSENISNKMASSFGNQTIALRKWQLFVRYLIWSKVLRNDIWPNKSHWRFNGCVMQHATCNVLMVC